MDEPLRRLLGWLGVAVGLCAAAVSAGWLWLTRVAAPPAAGDFRLIAAGLALLALVMALRCARAARAR